MLRNCERPAAGKKRVVNRNPFWLHALSDISLGIAAMCAAGIAIDVVRRPQKMAIMDVVWPITALYWGPLAVWAYRRVGLRTTRLHHDVIERTAGSERLRLAQDRLKSLPPTTTQTVVGDSHCGAGCTLGDLVGELLVAATGVTLFGATFPMRILVDFMLAWAFGVVFQYFTIARMRGLRVGEGIIASMKADTVSIVSFQIGMTVWMALTYFVLFRSPHLTPSDPVFWFMMQIAMVLGYVTSYPANAWLLRAGLKERMPDTPDAAFALDRTVS